MSYQEKRTLAFLASNVGIPLAWGLVLWLAWPQSFVTQSYTVAFWARAVIALIPLHVIVRMLILIGFALSQHARPNGDSVDVEDELDKIIDLKSTRFAQSFFLLGLLIGLACLAIGFPAKALVIAIALSIPVAGIAGDLRTLWLYRRGV